MSFVKLPTGIMNDRKLSHRAKRLYEVLIFRCMNKTFMYASEKTLAGDLGESLSTVERATRELKQRGLIVVKRRGLGMTNIVHLVDLEVVYGVRDNVAALGTPDPSAVTVPDPSAVTVPSKKEIDKGEGDGRGNAPSRVPNFTAGGRMANQRMPERMADLQLIARQGTEKAHAELKAHLKGKTGLTTAKMVRLFEAEAARATGHSFRAGAKDRGQIKNLMGMYGSDKTAELIRFTCSNWEVLKRELSVNSLTPGFVMGFRQSLLDMMDHGITKKTVGRDYDGTGADQLPDVGWGKRKKKTRG